MEAVETLQNLRVFVHTDAHLEQLRANKWAMYHPAPAIPKTIQGQEISFRPGLTLTPFANPVACNAHCRFCSEELQRRDGHQLTAKALISDHAAYFRSLHQAFLALAGLPIGLSLSGLEATADPAWLNALLQLLQHPAHIGLFDEKVLYSNGTGLYKFPWMIPALAATGFDRVELSRCHHDEKVNQTIMYFNRNEPVHRNAAYEDLLGQLLPQLHVRNSCILTLQGIHDLPGMEAYLDWAMELGVRDVVFRELSRLDDHYLPNATSKWVEANRIPIEPLLDELAPSLSETRAGWRHTGSTLGYYYYNEHFLYKGKVEVVVETSSYPALREANASQVVQKLVFHSNGHLCGDWDPNAHVVGKF